MSIITINNQKTYEVCIPAEFSAISFYLKYYMEVAMYMHYKIMIIYRHNSTILKGNGLLDEYAWLRTNEIARIRDEIEKASNTKNNDT